LSFQSFSGSLLWVTAHRIAKSRWSSSNCAYNDAPTTVFAKRTNWDLTPNPLAQAVAERRAAGLPIIDLTVSNPTQCGFSYETDIILAALQNTRMMTYEPEPKGLLAARQGVSGYYADRGDVVSIDDIFITTSTSEAYSWIFRLLCDPGDEVLIPSPGYPLFDFLAEINDVKLVRYPMFYDHGWHYDLYALEQAITERTRAVIVVHPNNPTGNYCKTNERKWLNEIGCAKQLAIIADEVFLDFALDGRRRDSFVNNGSGLISGNTAGPGQIGSGAGKTARELTSESGPLTFTLSGLSKICGLPQMKVAWLVLSGPSALKAEAAEKLEIISDTYLSSNTPLQLAVPELLSTRRRIQTQVQERVQANFVELDRLRMGTEERILRIEGGWAGILNVAPAQTKKLLADGILVHNGDLYGLPTRLSVVSLLVNSYELTRL
jgi:alanine-synthesizing transaminase